MRGYAKISTKFWTEIVRKDMKALGSDIIVISLYVQTCKHANMIGIYHLPLPYICYDTGIDEASVIASLKYLESVDFCTYDYDREYVWVRNMAFDQIAETLDIRDKRVKAINSIFNSLPDVSFLNNFYQQYRDQFHLTPHSSEKNKDTAKIDILQKNFSDTRPFQGASKALRSQEQEQYQEQEQKQEKVKQEQEGKHREVLRHRHDDSSEKIEVPAPQIVSPLSCVIAIPLRDGTEFPISPAMIEEWNQLYPSADILQQLKNIRGWNIANINKRKSHQSILQHINQWLAKENSKPTKSSVLEKPGGFNLFEHNTQVAKVWLGECDSYFDGRPDERE